MPQKLPKFAPFTLDFTFKRAFASEQCRDLLLFLLNTFLKRVLKEPIIDVKIIHTVQLGKGSFSNELHPEVRYNLMRMIFVRLTRFAKTEGLCKSDLDRMLFIFKNAHTLGKVPKSFKKTVFKRLFEIRGILQTAKNMLAKGFSVADVLKATNLPREQIRALMVERSRNQRA